MADNATGDPAIEAPTPERNAWGLSDWDDLVMNLPPCKLCDEPLKGWITSDGVHLDCHQQHPDAVFGGPHD